MSLIIRPIITEKTMNLVQAQNKFTFEVAPEANRTEAAAEVAKLFGVKVIDVTVQHRLGKQVAMGRQRRGMVKRKDTKMMTFKLKEGDRIDLFQV